MLKDDIPDLLPELRPYQRRAAYWMVQREVKGEGGSIFSPLCMPVDFIDSCERMFYNPFRYDFSVCAGILTLLLCLRYLLNEILKYHVTIN